MVLNLVVSLKEAQKGMRLLKEAGMKKINFSGGEPFLVQGGRFLGEISGYDSSFRIFLLKIYKIYIQQFKGID
jgi:hypothetical protein